MMTGYQPAIQKPNFDSRTRKLQKFAVKHSEETSIPHLFHLEHSMIVTLTNSNNIHSFYYWNMWHAMRHYWRRMFKVFFSFSLPLGDADEIGIPKTNTWYFNGYDTDECFDKYFENPTEHKPPTCYLGFPCTKVCNISR